jgi:hypothetical protein
MRLCLNNSARMRASLLARFQCCARRWSTFLSSFVFNFNAGSPVFTRMRINAAERIISTNDALRSGETHAAARSLGAGRAPVLAQVLRPRLNHKGLDVTARLSKVVK